MLPDIAIIGGGPAGLALAGQLEKAGLDYVVYERGSEETTPQGGCLDLHIGSGQRAMQEAGCFAEMKRYGRLGDATIHKVWSHEGKQVFAWGEGRDAPELDRSEIKAALLTTIPKSKILWQKTLTSATRNANNQIVLSFSDGTTSTGFKLVVGADGVWSKVRPLITSAQPKYSDIVFWTGKIHPSNPYYKSVEKMAGQGPQIIMGRSTKIWNQRQGDGHYRVDFGFYGPEDFGRQNPVDLSDEQAVKKLMLHDKFFGCHFQQAKELLQAVEGPFRAWPLYYMPPADLNWGASSDVTLVGDAAHTTTPFVGDGVNCALRDTVVLTKSLRAHGITKTAIEEYEKEMFPCAIDMIERSIVAGKLFFDWNSPKTFIEGMQARPLIGLSDKY